MIKSEPDDSPLVVVMPEAPPPPAGPDDSPLIVIMPEDPPLPSGPEEKSQSKKEDPKSLDIPMKIVDKLGTEDLDSYVRYKELIEQHQGILPEIAVPEQTTEDHNGQLKIAVRCQVCQKVCTCWTKLQYHLQTHVDLRPYKCMVCEKKFYAASKLHRHKQTHSGQKPHKCPLCDVRVSRQEHLKRHMLVHFEEKPYKCVACSHGARRVDSIRQHIKSKHPGEEVDWVFIGGDSEMRKEFVAKYLNEHLEKNKEETGTECEPGSVSPSADPTPGKLVEDSEQLAVNGSSEELPADQSTVNVVLLSKKKNKRKRKPSNPQQIKSDVMPKMAKSPVSAEKGENSNQISCVQQGNANAAPLPQRLLFPAPIKRETGSPCYLGNNTPRMPCMSVPKSEPGVFSCSQPQPWPQPLPVSSQSASISQNQLGHLNSQSQMMLPFSNQSQPMTYPVTSGMMYQPTASSQSNLQQSYGLTNQYPIGQMANSNFYGASLPQVMMMPGMSGNVSQIMTAPFQPHDRSHESQTAMSDFYRKRDVYAQLPKVPTPRQQTEG